MAASLDRPETCTRSTLMSRPRTLGALARFVAAMLLAVIVGCGETRQPSRRDVLTGGPSTTPGARVAKLLSSEQVDQMFRMGEDLAAAGKFKAAREQFEAVARHRVTREDEEGAATATFWAGLCAEKAGDVDAARKHYDAVLRTWPNARAAGQATRRLFGLK
jgi:hypothetical protein